MIIVKLVGGLTSQMHKYAIGRALAIKHNVPLKLDLSWFSNNSNSDTPWQYQLDNYNIKAEIATLEEIKNLKGSDTYIKWARRIKYYLGFNIYRNTYMNTSFLPIQKFSVLGENIYLEGEWSGSKYFEEYKNLIREDFQLAVLVSSKVNSIMDDIQNTNSVSLHIRRGDYISNKEAANFHSVCSLNYYEKAIEHIKKNIKDPVLYVFSDDIEWAKENISFDMKICFMDENKNYEDLLLMLKCKHNIIANSGFSWWASWLNNYASKVVIAPKEWVKDSKLNLKILSFLKSNDILFLEG